MTKKRLRAKAFILRTGEQKKAVASPLRLELLGLFIDRKPLSVAEIAERMGRSATGIHYHVRVLEKAGLLRRVGQQRSGRRPEALYKPVADVFKMAQPRDAPEEVAAVALKTMSTAFRMAERDMKAALTSPSSKTSGPYRNVLGARIEDQIDKCTIRTPAAGQVVYAQGKSILGQPIVIEEGNYVRNKQTIFRLPNPSKMQVNAAVNEASVAMVQEGMTARFRLDAFKDVEMTGSVRKVNEYPVPSDSLGTVVSEYETTVEIDELPKSETGEPLALRCGMTAEVKILVQTLPDVIQVPIQAVLEHGGKFYCVQRDELNDERFIFCEVTIGSTNEENVVILKGLEVGEQVVIEAAAYRDELAAKLDSLQAGT